MLDKQKLISAKEQAIQKINAFLSDFRDGMFPGPQSKGYIYEAEKNIGWTPGFYTGMMLLAYEMTEDKNLLNYIKPSVKSFKHRIEEQIGLSTHDLGFLYTLSCVAAYKVLGDEDAKKTAICAADYLIIRYKPIGEFIQAWGDVNDLSMYRLIIDCMLNLPLLYWATEVTGDSKYREIAERHSKTCLNCIIRNDGTTFHTHYFDPKTGGPTKGVTKQGYSDDSCWARGQAWGITGIALGYFYTKDESLIPLYKKLTDYFITHLGEDNIPYWDLCFTSGDQPRDTSAAAIAVCGILEMAKYINEPKHLDAADRILESLIDNYTTKDMPLSNGLLTDAMYNRNNGNEPECNLWGDYFYMEAIMRKLNPNWRMYW